MHRKILNNYIGKDILLVDDKNNQKYFYSWEGTTHKIKTSQQIKKYFVGETYNEIEENARDYIFNVVEKVKI